MHIHSKKSYFLCFIWNLLLQNCENSPDFLHFCWIIEEEPYDFFMFWKYFLPNLDLGYNFCHLGWQDLPLFAPLHTKPNLVNLWNYWTKSTNLQNIIYQAKCLKCKEPNILNLIFYQTLTTKSSLPILPNQI